MKFYVCIKQVPDVDAPIQIKDGELTQDSSRMTLNAYDASAVEEALVLTEEHDGEVEVVLIGPSNATESIRKALAMGAQKAVHIQTNGDENYDSAVYADILATFFEDKEYDIISCGKQAQDTDAGLTGSMLAEKLDLPYATNAVGLDIEGDALVAKRQGDDGQEVIELPAPCLVTCSNDMNEPRIPSLKGIMKSKKKPMEQIELSSIDMGDDTLIAKTTITSYQEKPEREAGEKYEGEPDEIAQEVAQLLDSEAGVL